MIKGILTVLAIIFLAITTAINHSGERNLEKRILVGSYPAQMEEYLETKYGETFSIDPNHEIRTSGPIPGDTDDPYIYKVREKGGDRYMFQTFVYPMADNDKHIKTIEDGYYWKTIEKETKEFIETKMQGLLPKEYKILLLPAPSATFDAASLSLPMETYFSTQVYSTSIRIHILAPPKEDTEEELLTKDSVYPILNDFYKLNSGHIRIDFIYDRTASEEDYQRIDIESFETSVYMDYDESKMIWDSVEQVAGLRVNVE